MAIHIFLILTLLLLSLISDIRTRKISNSITLSFAAFGIGANFIMRGVSGAFFSLPGWCIPIIILFPLYGLRMLGAGDIKLFGAIGAILGYEFAVYSAAYSFLFGGLIGIGILIKRRNAAKRIKHLVAYLKSCILMLKLQHYSDFEDSADGGLFRFSYAVVPGTCLQLIIMFLGAQGVI